MNAKNDDDGATALHLAIRNRNIQIVECLIKNFISTIHLDGKNKNGEAPAYLARIRIQAKIE